ncbi:hypothetical protein MMPV_001703 [Pyropia vietnamensis]
MRSPQGAYVPSLSIAAQATASSWTGGCPVTVTRPAALPAAARQLGRRPSGAVAPSIPPPDNQRLMIPVAVAAANASATNAPAVAPLGEVTLLDYGAGNVRSLENALTALGATVRWVQSPDDITDASRLIFPGVGSFGVAMANLEARGYVPALRAYLSSGKPFLGICIGLQSLFEGSDESPGVAGLGVFPGRVRKFDFLGSPADGNSAAGSRGLSVPHMGWNTVDLDRPSPLFAGGLAAERFYYVHSFFVPVEAAGAGGALATTTHGTPFVAVLQRGSVMATQFHPEKSGPAGLALLRNFLTAPDPAGSPPADEAQAQASLIAAQRSDAGRAGGLAKRIVACLDVRENDAGDLVVTKGDQYDVREATDPTSGGAPGAVRNLGKPVELAARYYNAGADEVTFLNITSFRGEPLADAPLLAVLAATSTRVFVPLCIGGGIRDYTDASGVTYSALDVAARYFRAGADKISLGSDAVYAAEAWYAAGRVGDGSSSIETISNVYGAQAVVISIDPRRVWVTDPADTPHATLSPSNGATGPAGETYCWYQCTVKGGREGRDLDVVQLAIAVTALGAGELLVNSMDADGQKSGYDHDLIASVRAAVAVPVIASSGAGAPEHFGAVFAETEVEAALAAGIFHRGEVGIGEVKAWLAAQGGMPVRIAAVANAAGGKVSAEGRGV